MSWHLRFPTSHSMSTHPTLRVRAGKIDCRYSLRHSYACHLLMNGVQINYLSRWLGHSSIQMTLIYLELVPDPWGSLDRVR